MGQPIQGPQRPAAPPQRQSAAASQLTAELRRRLQERRNTDRPSHPFIRPESRPMESETEEEIDDASSSDDDITSGSEASNGNKRARTDDEYSLHMGYDKRVFLEQPLLRRLKVLPDTETWAKTMRPSARVHGDVEKGASQLNVKGMKQWPIIGRIRDTNSKNFYSRPGPDDEATYPLESWDQEFVSIQFADDMTDSYFSDAQQLEVEEVINIESDFGVSLPMHMPIVSPARLRRCMEELTDRLAKPVEDSDSRELYFPSTNQVATELRKLIEEQDDQLGGNARVREYRA